MHVHGSSLRTPREQLEQPDLAPPRAAYQGIAGAYGEEAVRRIWHGRARAIPTRTFADALAALVSGRVHWAVIPISNSSIGPVAPARAALRALGSAIVVTRQVDVPVRHCLLALPGTSIADIRYVGSHPAALAQCTRLFAANDALVACAAFDTAGAARELATLGKLGKLGELGDATRPRTSDTWYSALAIDGPTRLAAIASADAGRQYGLSILREGVQDNPTNVTRFAVVRAKEPRRR